MYLTKLKLSRDKIIDKAPRDSNSQPADYKSAALPTVLSEHSGSYRTRTYGRLVMSQMLSPTKLMIQNGQSRIRTCNVSNVTDLQSAVIPPSSPSTLNGATKTRTWTTSHNVGGISGPLGYLLPHSTLLSIYFSFRVIPIKHPRFNFFPCS